MEVILLERIAKLGQMGDVVRVKDGYARNFLLPKKKALRATGENKTRFEGMKGELEAHNLALKGEAQGAAGKLDGQSFIILRQSSETGQLYGSVTARDLAVAMEEKGFKVTRNQVALDAPIKSIGKHKVAIALHPEVEINITVLVGRTPDEAERLARGEDVTVRRDQTAQEEALAVAEGFFENPEAAGRLDGDDESESEPAR
jgi:large subunit ribosomal protein L9